MRTSVVRNAKRVDVERIGKTVAELSSRFGEVQGFASHRVVEYHHWMLARQGKLIRAFAYLGESGEIHAQFGPVTDAERQLRTAGLPPDQWTATEDDVMKIAAAWSYDPTQLSPSSAPPANGILVSLK